MVSKKIVTGLCVVIAVTLLCKGCLKKQPQQVVENNKPEVKQITPQPKPVEPKYDLYNSTPYDLPLISIAEISKLPLNIKKKIDEILETSQGFYYLKVYEDNVFIILQNPVFVGDVYNRHNLQFVELSMDGEVKYHSAGYLGKEGEILAEAKTKEDLWAYDESSEQLRPQKHIKYDEKGKVKYTEYWNYEENEPIKYQMKDAHKKVVSILKESQDNDSNLRREHLFYDNDGNITMSLTVNYDGANISRLTFYNSHDLIDSVSIISEFVDGIKVKEQVYNEDYKLLYTVVSENENGERKTIVVYDSEGNIVNKISS